MNEEKKKKKKKRVSNLALPSVAVKELSRRDEGLIKGPESEEGGDVVAETKDEEETESHSDGRDPEQSDV